MAFVHMVSAQTPGHPPMHPESLSGLDEVNVAAVDIFVSVIHLVSETKS